MPSEKPKDPSKDKKKKPKSQRPTDVSENHTRSKTLYIPRPPIVPFRGQFSIIPHVLTILTVIFTIGFIIASYAGTTVISSISPGGSVAGQPWMLLVNETSSSTGVKGNDRYGMYRYGFSPFKVCRWNFDKADMLKPAVCAGPAWVMGDMGDLPDLKDLGISLTIRSVLPIFGHLLFIYILIALYHLYDLIHSLIFPAYASMVNRQYGPTTSSRGEYAYPKILSSNKSNWDASSKRLARYLRLRRPGGPWFIVWIREWIVSLVVIVVVLGLYKQGSKELEVELGLGGILLFAVSVLDLLIVGLVPWTFGLFATGKKEPKGGARAKEDVV